MISRAAFQPRERVGIFFLGSPARCQGLSVGAQSEELPSDAGGGCPGILTNGSGVIPSDSPSNAWGFFFHLYVFFLNMHGIMGGKSICIMGFFPQMHGFMGFVNGIITHKPPNHLEPPGPTMALACTLATQAVAAARGCRKPHEPGLVESVPMEWLSRGWFP